MQEEKLTPAAYFEAERDRFVHIAGQSSLVSNLVGRRAADLRRVWASWLFTRAGVTSNSVERLLTPYPSGFGDISYLDHASLASLARNLIENVAVLLYLCDAEIDDTEAQCRKHLIDLHDYKSRRAFLSLLGKDETEEPPEEVFRELRDRLRNNLFFQSLPSKMQKRILNAEDMFIGGRLNALTKIGWTEDHTKAIYKYLSMQTHTAPMSFHRTEINRIYAKESNNAKVVSGFAIEQARQALGVACLKMLQLFPDIEGKLEQAAVAELKRDYSS